MTTAAGEFWTVPQPDRRIGGSFNAELGEPVEVDLDAVLAVDLDADDAPAPRPAPQRGDVAGAMNVAAAGEVARRRPFNFWGQLATGEPVSVFEATNQGMSGAAAHYVAPIAVIGANVTPEQRYASVRFRLDHPYWLRHLADNDSSGVGDDHSTLRVEASAHGNWLVYESSTAATLVELEMRAISGCLVLAQLALFPDRERESDLRTRETQVRIDSAGPWLTVRGPMFCAPTPAALDTDFLLLPTELTIDRFAKWIAVNDKFDGLAWAVARRMNLPIPLHVQLLTSLVEGIHLRLTPEHEQTWFPDASKAALKRIRRAATQAAVDQAHTLGLDPDAVGMRVWNALGHWVNKSYLERAEEVVTAACAAVPELGLSITRLAKHLRDSRITFAHQLRPEGDLQERHERWMVLFIITPWLLRARLLLEAGIDPAVLREKYLENETFTLHREQAEIRVRKLRWDQPPEPPSKRRTWTPSVTPENPAPTRMDLIKDLIKSFLPR
ncbi:hypothetical protein OK015_28835 (plasmid) [Mycobacterium sp. Aquia_216]|uniref:hypothetical protein n=1 Tax=Mycobacterium sp. Aquia_216 TaxID=2991729 RepID=UPI00227CCFD1|nr:hypothetical protein [Mycobacterium sp. Aquia_216]WAJ47960.1 hypothetical protein OK015_28835 [Mycobacterium sp. Aquia_216]